MVFKKITDHRTADIFGARLMLQIIDMAHCVLKTNIVVPEESSPGFEFDCKYEPILSALSACRQSRNDTLLLISDHKKRVQFNENARDHHGYLEISETIDAAVIENVTAFITDGVVAMKGIQNVGTLFDLDIGYLFQKRDQFNKGIDELYACRQHFLASYLKQVRNFWSEKFLNRRNELVHNGWSLSGFEYKRLGSGKIEAVEPLIDDLSVSDYMIIMSNRIFSFVENILVHGIKQKLKAHETIVEIPGEERDPALVVRFKIVPRSEAAMEWDIRYSENDFCYD